MSFINPQNIVDGVTNTKPREAILALLVGAILGFVFVKLKLPIPAPPVLVGIIGIIGIWIGYVLGAK